MKAKRNIIAVGITEYIERDESCSMPTLRLSAEYFEFLIFQLLILIFPEQIICSDAIINLSIATSVPRSILSSG